MFWATTSPSDDTAYLVADGFPRNADFWYDSSGKEG